MHVHLRRARNNASEPAECAQYNTIPAAVATMRSWRLSKALCHATVTRNAAAVRSAANSASVGSSAADDDDDDPDADADADAADAAADADADDADADDADADADADEDAADAEDGEISAGAAIA